MTYKELIGEKSENILTIKFNRPEQMNAINSQLTSEFLDALVIADRESEVRVVIITGTGNAF
jgi:enoyl-CoA hydratase/carnithine racemase